MHTFPFTRMYAVVLVATLGFSPVVAYAGNATPVVTGKSAYRLPLVHGAGGLQFSETETSVVADLVSVRPPKIGIGIFEPTGAGPGAMKWQYAFGPLSAGNEFVMQGRLYRVNGIDESWLGVAPANRSTWRCKQKSCVPYIDVVRLPQVVSTAGRNALVVSRSGPYPNEPQPGSSASLYTALDQCSLDLYLDGLSQSPHDYVAHMRSKLDAFEYKRNASKCQEKVDTGSVDAHVGDIVSFGDFGRFKVESILPADAHHKDWVVLVPAKAR